jgi:hypothetical protein
MTTPSKGSGIDSFLEDDPNKITAADFEAPTKPPVIEPPKIQPPDSKARFKTNFGWRRNFKRPEGINISDKMLPPITRRGIAIYETLQETKFDPRIIEGDKAIAPPPMDLPPTYPWYDPGEEDYSLRRKMMKNVTRSEVRQIRQSDGQIKPQLEEVLEYVVFANGRKEVNQQSDYVLYCFLELHPLNESNKYRDQSKKALFKRTDFEFRSSAVQMLEMDLQDEASKYLGSLNEKEIINLASAMTNPPIAVINVPTSDIRYNLRLRARNNPKDIVYRNPDKKAAARIDILHALENGCLEYIPEFNAFFLDDPKTPFFEVSISATNPVDDLAIHLTSSDGKEAYEAILDYVNFWKK